MSTVTSPGKAHSHANRDELKIVVVGAGFGGIAAVIELKKHGFNDITVFEAAPDIGGTWYYNNYPGAACDVPSHFYSYSFAQRSTWSRLCSPRDEIFGYLKETADHYHVTPHVVTDTRVTGCHWDDDKARWNVHIQNSQGTATLAADVVILATGQLNQPAYPALEGLQDFAGRSFHSARWDTQYDLNGKRVAVIGTGASAIQFVPNIVNTVAHLTVFQRSGNWLLPLKNLPYAKTISTCFRRMPALSRAWRTCISLYLEGLTAMVRHPRTLGKIGKFVSSAFMRRQLRDPETRKKAWPDYPYGCKRILFSSSYLPALQRANVSLITERIVRMTPQGPETADGKIHEVDCVIYSTGFRAMDFMFPMEITGVAGRSLREAWAQGAKAHLGITIAGFPSLFVMYGPNTNTSGGSVVYFLEAQARYLRQALQWMRQQQAAAIDVRPEVEAASTAKVQSRFQGTAWTACHSWYQDAHGRIVANWPGYMREYARQTARLNPDDYRLVYAKA